MVKFKWSKDAEAVRSRIRRLPQMMTGLMRAQTLGDSNAVIKEFQQGIKKNTLGLRKLQPGTVVRKTALEYDKPESPLYAFGRNEKNSYFNSLEVFREGQRVFIVRPRKGEWHHGKVGKDDPPKRKIKLEDLFDVHEYGAIIANAFGRGIVVRIPPRPALRYAFRLHMKRRSRQDPSKKVKAAVRQLVQEGDARALKRIEQKLDAAGVAESGGKLYPKLPKFHKAAGGLYD